MTNFNFKKIKFVFGYYYHKGKAKLLTKLLEKFAGFQKLDSTVFFKKPKDFCFSGKIVFAFWNPKIIHLGDQLFYQPVIEFLNKRFEVVVLTYPAMQGYFSSLGYKTSSLVELKKEQIEGAIFISNKDFLWEMGKNFPKKNVFIGINYATPTKAKRVVELIFDLVLEVFEKINIFKKPLIFNEADIYPKVSPLLLERYNLADFLKIFLENPDKKFILFNNYVFSHFHGITKKREKLLENLVKTKKDEGFLVVHVGSQKDKEIDKKVYDFVDYDLRGKIEPLGLFKVFSLSNVYGIVSFDTFLIHVASILRKNLYVVIKGRSDKKENEKIRKIFVPMASCFEDLVKKIIL